MNINGSIFPKYAFDMIMGSTQTPLAATMKEFLDHVDGKEFAVCYVEKKDATTGDWAIVPTDYNKLKQNLGIDPFSIAEKGSAHRYAERLYTEFNFVFGFKASMNTSGIAGMRGITYSLRWLYPSKKSSGYYEGKAIDKLMHPENADVY